MIPDPGLDLSRHYFDLPCMSLTTSTQRVRVLKPLRRKAPPLAPGKSDGPR
jgi:hypothetical protein